MEVIIKAETMTYEPCLIKRVKCKYICEALGNGTVKPEATSEVRNMLKALNGTQNKYLKYNNYVEGPLFVFIILGIILYGVVGKSIIIIIIVPALFFVFLVNLFIYHFWTRRNAKKYNKVIEKYREKLLPYYLVIDQNGEYVSDSEERYTYTERNLNYKTIKLVPIEQAERIRTLNGNMGSGNNSIDEVEPSYHTVNDSNIIIPIHQVNLNDLPNYNSQIGNRGIPDLKKS